MKIILSIILFILGIISGLYFGIWWAFIGGIIQIIEQVRAPELEAAKVAIGVARIVFAALIGWLSAVIFFFPALAIAGFGPSIYVKRRGRKKDIFKWE